MNSVSGLRICAAAVLAAAALGVDSTEECLTVGIAYNDSQVQGAFNGGVLPDAAACQASCAAGPYCAHFTFYNNSKACWLQGDKVHSFEEKDAISGLGNCTEAVAAVPLVLGEAPLMSQDNAPNAAADSGASSGFPWWGWVVGGLGLAGAAGAATVFYSEYSTAKKSAKKTKSRAVRLTDDEAPALAADSVPLMQAVEMPPLASQQQQFAYTAAAPTYSAAPMATYSAAPVAASYAAAPMATYSAPQGYSVSAAPVNYAAPMNYAPAAPTYSAAPPAMYSPAPVPNYAPAPVAYSAAPANYAQEPVANYAPAAPTYMQPVSAMAAQFNRADLDGDGVISREEYARLTGHQ
eukprot:CAMPEP_0115068598 /NCGR_PEP_ID=MMETSP0227-20121206/12065_1 /TAXON_ID=89957 /ORGANISM="Polarella glacialis, Strain CCMP 1383" /LENGTH=349 /DNA_ID=CAMNT_0002454855 /DNA_START=68 /DNA_END=1117 /DNA_ORIENTATION=+